MMKGENYSFAIFYFFILSTSSRDIWRASQPGGLVNENAFLASSPIILSFLPQNNGSFIEWSSASTCIINNKSVPETFIQCDAGLHAVTATVMTQDEQVNITQLIPVKLQSHCYMWYMHMARFEDKYSMFVWIVEVGRQSEHEKADTAQSPSEHSAKLTRTFKIKGQVPLIWELNADHKMPLSFHNLSYDSAGYWQLDVLPHKDKFHYSLLVKGKEGISVNGCYLKKPPMQILLPKFVNLESLDSTSPHLPSDNILPLVIQDHCNLHVAICFVSAKVYLTQDGFQSSHQLRVQPNTLKAGDKISHAAFTSSDVIMLTSSGSLIIFNTDINQYKYIKGISGITNIRSRSTCVTAINMKSFNDAVLAWNQTSLYLSVTPSPSFNHIDIPINLLEVLGYTADDVEITIQDVTFSATTVNHVMLVLSAKQDNNHQSLVFFIYDITTDVWHHLPCWVEDHLHETFHINAVPCAEECYVFWNHNSLFYIKDNGFQQGRFVIFGEDSQTLNRSADDSIQQVTVSVKGQILVLMTSGSIFSGRFDEGMLIQIFSLYSDEVFLTFNELGRGFSISLEGDGIKRSELRSEQAVTVSLLSFSDSEDNEEYLDCKYYAFDHPDVLDVYYTDLNEEVHLWASLTHPISKFNDISVSSSYIEEFSLSTIKMTKIHQDRKFINVSILMRSNADLYQVLDHKAHLEDVTGLAAIEIKPYRRGIKCSQDSQIVTNVAIGCPPGRHIKVRKPLLCSEIDTYTIPRVALSEDEDDNEDLPVDYNFPLYGCPIHIANITSSFRPTVDVYDGDWFLHEMTSDYFIHEVHGRCDFRYTATMDDAYCSSIAQSWTVMQDMADVGVEDHLIWGPHNYHSCYDGSNFTYDAIKDRQYEVLNSSGVAAIEWTNQVNNSIYQFRLQVLDPNYSFCSFETYFAVLVPEVKNPASNEKHALVQFGLLSFALTTFSLGFITYIYFRKKHILEWEIYLKDFDVASNVSSGSTESVQPDQIPMEALRVGRRGTVITR